MSDKLTRDLNRRIIKETIEYVSPGADASPLLAFALRESNFNHRVDSKNQADIEAGKRAFDRNLARSYSQNRWRNEPGLWHTSRGLFQFVVANHLLRWDRNADPRVLWHPVVSTIVAARLWNRMVQQGASTVCDMRSGWAGGPGYWRKDPNYQQRCESLRARLVRMGFDPSLADRDAKSFGYEVFGTGPQPWDAAVVAQVSGVNGIMDHLSPEWIPESWTEGNIFRPMPPRPNETKKTTTFPNLVAWLSLSFLIYRIAKGGQK